MTSKLGTKGVKSLQRHSKNKEDELDIQVGQFVHVECRRQYCHPRQDNNFCRPPDNIACERQRRSGDTLFRFERDCFFCGTLAKLNGKKRGHDVFPVRTFDFQKTIRDLCTQRDDEWGNTVFGRLEYAQDLPAVEARYHQICSTNFRTGNNIPHRFKHSDQDKRKGRPVKPTIEAAFMKVMGYLEDNKNQQQSVSDLVKKMEDLCGPEAYSIPYMKKKTLDYLGCEVIISEVNGKQDDKVNIDPQLLFQRLLTVSDNTMDNPIEVFKHELCSHPASLFDNSGLLRQSAKSQLAKIIWDLGDCGVEAVPTDVTFVLDGGSLIHRLPWLRGINYGTIWESYCNMILGMYGHPHVVFDGYKNGITTKDVAHERRSKGFKGPTMLFYGNTPFKTKKDVFLSNDANKQHFIDLLAVYLEQRWCIVHLAPDDADMLITRTALNLAKQSAVAVIGEDTDLLVLLCHHAVESTSQSPIFFLSDVKHGMKKKKIWNIGKAQKVLGKDTCFLLPFIHAFSGCDTTSPVYGLSKNIILRKVMSEENLKRHAYVFLKDSTQSEVQAAGEEALLCLYQAKNITGLDILRYCRFLQKVQTKSTALQVKSLPPTSNAAKFHSFRTYLQIATWLGKSLKPDDWGWCSSDGKLTPIKTTLPAAPDRLLKCVGCSCKQNCDSKRCTCRRHGLPCTAACAECRGMNCTNRDRVVLEDYNQE